MTSKKRLHIAVDLDGITADLHSRWLELYNADYQHGTQLEDLKSWDMHQNVKIGQDIYKYLDAPNLYIDLEPVPGAVQALGRLHERGYEIHIISSPAKATQTAADKLVWCKKHLSFLNRRAITLSHQKQRFLTDVFIDDSPNNLRRHAQFQPKAVRMGIAWPYNAQAADVMDLRAESYRDPAGAWAHMLDFIESLAERPEFSR